MNIILVDDDLDDVLLFREAIKDISKSIECVELGSGPDLLNYLAVASCKPNMIFLDYNMPGMNGFECLSEMRKTESYRDIPVVMYTTYLSPGQERNFENLAVSILIKPNTYSDLVEAIESKIIELTPQII